MSGGAGLSGTVEADRVSRPIWDTLRGLTLWLGAALVGGFGAAVTLNALHGGGWTSLELAGLFGASIIALLWTLPGSALLTLAFAWSGWSGSSAALRRVVLIPVGAAAGAAAGFFFDTGLTFGFIFGAATAVAWGAFQWAIYGRR